MAESDGFCGESGVVPALTGFATLGYLLYCLVYFFGMLKGGGEVM